MLDHLCLHKIIGNNDPNGENRLGSDFGDLYAHALIGERILPTFPPFPSIQTNFLPNPSEFNAWQVWTGTLLPNQAIGPDGSLTADKWIGGQHNYGQRVAFYDLYPPSVPQIPSGSTCRASICVKRFGTQARNIQINLWWAGTVNFNLDNPALSTTSFISSNFALNYFDVNYLGDEWYRCYFVFTYFSHPSWSWYFRYHLRMLDGNLISDYPGTDTSGLYLSNAEFGIVQ